jgi:hypothetical protein
MEWFQDLLADIMKSYNNIGNGQIGTKFDSAPQALGITSFLVVATGLMIYNTCNSKTAYDKCTAGITTFTLGAITAFAAHNAFFTLMGEEAMPSDGGV